MKFKHKTMTQTQLGELFGVSSHDIGKWLTDVGLRDPKKKKPSWDAYDGGFCVLAPNGFFAGDWVTDLTVAKLQDAGHSILSMPPESLVEVPPLNGPFHLQENNVICADGTLAARAACRKNAESLHRMLEMAHRAGLINKLTAAQTAC